MISIAKLVLLPLLYRLRPHKLTTAWYISYKTEHVENTKLPYWPWLHPMYRLESTASLAHRSLHYQWAVTTVTCDYCHYNDVIMTTIASQITSLTVVYSTVYSDGDQRKHQSSASLAFVWGIHRDRWIPRTKGQLRGKCFHLMTSSCYMRFQLALLFMRAMLFNKSKVVLRVKVYFTRQKLFHTWWTIISKTYLQQILKKTACG